MAARLPVVLVHGILGNRLLYWNLFRSRLERDGFAVHEASLPYAALGDLKRAAQALAGDVEEACEDAAATQVDMVCHSAGGLAARYYLKFLDGGKRVRRLVLLGTPHRGTYFSYTMPVLSVARQARPGAGILAELGDRHEEGPTEVTNFWSPVDGIVIPAAHSRLDGVRNVRVDWLHHWGFLVSGALYEKVRRVLLAPNRQR